MHTKKSAYHREDGNTTKTPPTALLVSELIPNVDGRATTKNTALSDCVHHGQYQYLHHDRRIVVNEQFLIE